MSDRNALRRPIMRLVTAVMDDRVPGDSTLGQIADDLLNEIEPLIRADERDKFMEEARSDIAAAVLINEAKADERERIAQAFDKRAAVAREQAKSRNGPMLARVYWETAEAYEAAARIARDGGGQ